MTQNDTFSAFTIPPKDAPTPLGRQGLPKGSFWFLSGLTTLACFMLCGGLYALFNRLPAWIPPMVAEAVALGVSVLLLIVLFRVCRAMRWVPILLIFLSGPVFSSFGSFAAVLVLVSALFAVSVGALLLSVCSREQLIRLPFVPILAFGVSAALCGSPAGALLCLVPLPAAVGLAFGTRASVNKEGGPGRVGVICLTSLCFGLTILIVCAVAFRSLVGELSFPSLASQLEALRTEMTRETMDFFASLAEATGQSALAITQDTAGNIVNDFINILPATLVILSNLFAALTQCLLHGSLCTLGFAGSVNGRVKLFRMSLVSGIVFLLAYLVTLIASKGGTSSTLVGTVAENIAMILQPGLALCGTLRLLYTITRRRAGGCLPFFLLMLIPFLLFYSAVLLAVFEAVASVVSIFTSRKRPPADNGSGSDRSDSDSSDGSDDSPF